MEWHEIGMYGVFFTGQLIHLWQKAAGVAGSSLPNGIDSVRQYLDIRKSQIAGQVFLALLFYWLVLHNPKMLNLDTMGDSYEVRLAIAGMAGWFGDSAGEKLTRVFEGILNRFGIGG